MVRPALAALSLLAKIRFVIVFVIGLVPVMVPGTARAQTDGAPDTERYTLRTEVGLEYDTNAHRTEMIAGADNPPVVASPLERLVLAATLSDLVADGQLLTLAATAAGKIYDAPAAYSEDVAIAQSSLAWAKALGRRATLTLSGAYYEAFQAPANDLVGASERRDFRSLGSSVQLGWIAGEHLEVSLNAGYRGFVFKPDRDDDFTAPTAAAELRWTRQTSDADWEVSTGASFEHRTFGGPALTTDCPGENLLANQAVFACAGPETRRDDFLMSHLDLLRVGRVLLGAGYAFHDNRSNSYGESVVRHIATARFAAPLPGGFTLAARGEVLLAFYRQPMIVGQQVAAGNTFSSIESIEDENRSSVRVDLSHDLANGLRLLARYTFYANEIANASPISYQRQTLLLSLTGALEK